jgi:hypothetical protein
MHLTEVKRTHPALLEFMARHYSKPRGFVGRSIAFLIYERSIIVGAVVAGSATLHLAGRDQFFGVPKSKAERKAILRNIVNNVFFRIEKDLFPYKPPRNYFRKALLLFERTIERRWEEKYGDPVLGIESLIELPRTGVGYTRAGYTEVGQTVGYTCKRESHLTHVGKGNRDSWTGVRVWNTDPKSLRPKRVMCKRLRAEDTTTVGLSCAS